MPTPHRDELWRLATGKWAKIVAVSPDLAAPADLQRRLLTLMLDASALIDAAGLPQLDMDAARRNWARGLPALRNQAVAIPPGLKDILQPICAVLAEGGAGDSALHVRDAIAASSIDADSLLGVSLARHPKAIRTSSLHMGFSPDLVWLIGELGSAPLANALQQRLGDPPDGWNRGYCPACGSWPVFIEAHGAGHRQRCSYCTRAWSLDPHRCGYCGNAGEDFVAAAIDVDRPQKRVELCGRCTGYTKVIDAPEPTPFPLLAIEDLATMDLDQGAMARGYRRPELFDLDTIEPRASTC